MAEAPKDRAAAIRTWLMKAPRPHTVRVFGKDAREYDCEIKSGAAWSDTAVSIASLEPVRLEAMSAEGKLLRAVVVDSLIEKEEQAAAHAQTVFQAFQSTDPETQRIIVFAQLIERAHERATTAIQETVGVAFGKMQEICDSLAQQAATDRGSANELTLGIRQLIIQQAQEAAERLTEPETSPLEKMAESFMSGQAMAQAEQPAAAAAAKPTNGKH
jgi:hypothetical protein